MKPSPPEPKQGIRLSGLGEWSDREHRLGASETSVGSGRENDLVIEHTTVSRKHAVLRYLNDRYTVTDLGSTNGTFVNGRRIKGSVRIGPGDEISFGAARFAMLGGTGIMRAKRRRRSIPRIVAAVAGIALFAIAGFMATRYVIESERLASRPTEPSNEETASKAPVAAPSEVAESSAEVSSTPAAPESAEVEAPSPIWLKQLNDFRAEENLAPVSSDEKLTAGDHQHAIYLLKNFATEIHDGILGPEVHSEDSSNSWYTPEGDEAAHASDIAEQRGIPGGSSPIHSTGRLRAGWSRRSIACRC